MFSLESGAIEQLVIDVDGGLFDLFSDRMTVGLEDFSINPLDGTVRLAKTSGELQGGNGGGNQ